nr:hypothetical protein [Tanacetum cinerariifolium]
QSPASPPAPFAGCRARAAFRSGTQAHVEAQHHGAHVGVVGVGRVGARVHWVHADGVARRGVVDVARAVAQGVVLLGVPAFPGRPGVEVAPAEVHRQRPQMQLVGDGGREGVVQRHVLEAGVAGVAGVAVAAGVGVVEAGAVLAGILSRP